MGVGEILEDDNGRPLIAGLDPTTHRVASFQLVNTQSDSTSGASFGSLVVAENEYNGGGPSGINYEPKRNLQGKGTLNVAVIASGGTIGSTLITLTSTPSTILPGQTLYLYGGTSEGISVSQNYVPGTNPVTLLSPIQQSGHIYIYWEQYSINGPALGAMTAIGVGLKAKALYDPSTGFYYLARASTQDGVVASNMEEVGIGLWNGTNMDRLVGLNGIATMQNPTRYLTLKGQSYSGTTGIPSLAAGTYGLSLFNTATSGKNVLLYSLRIANGGGSMAWQLNSVTTNPSFGNSVTAVNAKAGGATSVASVTYASTSQTMTGTVLMAEPGPQNQSVELLTNDATLLLPSGAANGVVAYLTTFSTGYISINARWLEY